MSDLERLALTLAEGLGETASLFPVEVSKIWPGTRTRKDYSMKTTETTLIPHQTLTMIVENVTQARADVAQGFALLVGAKDRLRAVLGAEPRYYDTLWSDRISDYHLDNTAKQVDAQLARTAWAYVIQQLGLNAWMTEKRQNELHEQLTRGTFPPLTVENILGTLQGLTSQVETLLQEAAQEVFEWLRPCHPHGVGALKTNQKWRVGDKAIVDYAVEPGWMQGYRLTTSREANFRTLGNVFSLLDGQGAQRSPDDLCTQLRVGLARAESGAQVSTPYVNLKPYKNGHAHLTFRRHDLVDRLNQLGGDGALTP